MQNFTGDRRTRPFISGADLSEEENSRNLVFDESARAISPKGRDISSPRPLHPTTRSHIPFAIFPKSFEAPRVSEITFEPSRSQAQLGAASKSFDASRYQFPPPGLPKPETRTPVKQNDDDLLNHLTMDFLTLADSPDWTSSTPQRVSRCMYELTAPKPFQVPPKMGYCTLCLDFFWNREPHSTLCGHVFCKKCIIRWIARKNHCPKCRKALTVFAIHPIFLQN